MSNKFFGKINSNEEETTVENKNEVVEDTSNTETEVLQEPITEQVEEANNDTPNFTNKTIGVWKKAPNLYHLVEIEYNPETGETSKAKVLEEFATDRNTINEAFKIKVVKSGVLG